MCVMASQGARGPRRPRVHQGPSHAAIFQKSWEIIEFGLQLLWANSQVFKGSRCFRPYLWGTVPCLTPDFVKLLLHFERQHLQTQSGPESFLAVKITGVCWKHRFPGVCRDLPSRRVRKGGLGFCSCGKSQSHSNQENHRLPGAPSSLRIPSLAFSAGFSSPMD